MNHQHRSGISTATFLVVVFVVMVFGIIWYAASRPWSGFGDLSVGECLARDGVVVDPLGGEFRYEAGDFLGNVDGLSCPCICLNREGLARAKNGGE